MIYPGLRSLHWMSLRSKSAFQKMTRKKAKIQRNSLIRKQNQTYIKRYRTYLCERITAYFLLRFKKPTLKLKRLLWKNAKSIVLATERCEYKNSLLINFETFRNFFILTKALKTSSTWKDGNRDDEVWRNGAQVGEQVHRDVDGKVPAKWRN